MNTTDEDDPAASRRQAWDLIPWVVAGSASPAEQRLLAEHTAASAEVRDEPAFHRAVKAGMDDSAAPPHDAEPARRRLARIEQADDGPPLSAPPAGRAALAGMRLVPAPRADCQTLSQPALPAAATVRVAAAASVLIGELRALLDRLQWWVVDINADGSLLGLAAQPGPAAPVADLLAALRAAPRILLAEPVHGAAEPAG